MRILEASAFCEFIWFCNFPSNNTLSYLHPDQNQMNGCIYAPIELFSY